MKLFRSEFVVIFSIVIDGDGREYGYANIEAAEDMCRTLFYEGAKVKAFAYCNNKQILLACYANNVVDHWGFASLPPGGEG